MSDLPEVVENDAACLCDPRDAALALVVWEGAEGADRAVCALCGRVGVIPPAVTEGPSGNQSLT